MARPALCEIEWDPSKPNPQTFTVIAESSKAKARASERTTLDSMKPGHKMDSKKSFCIVKRFEPGKIYILTALRSASSPTTTPLDTPPERAGKS